MELLITNLQTILGGWLEQAGENLPRLVMATLVALFFLYLAGLLSRVLARSMKRRHTNPEYVDLLARLLRGSVIVLGVVLALEQAGTDVSALLTGLGILGFTLGFALQDISKNFVAGLLILFTQPFTLGDVVEVAGFSGRVRDINLRDLVMEANDGLYVRIPNADVITGSLINYTRTHKRRIALRLRVAYDTDLAIARAAILRGLKNVPGLLETPQPEVVFDTFGVLGIEGEARYWIDVTQTELPTGQMTGIQEIQRAFEELGISVPTGPSG